MVAFGTDAILEISFKLLLFDSDFKTSFFKETIGTGSFILSLMINFDECLGFSGKFSYLLLAGGVISFERCLSKNIVSSDFLLLIAPLLTRIGFAVGGGGTGRFGGSPCDGNLFSSLEGVCVIRFEGTFGLTAISFGGITGLSSFGGAGALRIGRSRLESKR